MILSKKRITKALIRLHRCMVCTCSIDKPKKAGFLVSRPISFEPNVTFILLTTGLGLIAGTPLSMLCARIKHMDL